MKVKIEVKQEHINTGKAADCYKCPIALAISEHIDSEWVETHVVDNSVSFLPITGSETVKKLPYQVRDFIYSFDKKEEVKPFDFDLFIPNRHLKSVAEV